VAPTAENNGNESYNLLARFASTHDVADVSSLGGLHIVGLTVLE
jgi:hypothetical protein